MLHNRINIWNEDAYNYSAAFGFRPNLRTYLHEDKQMRPCVLVIPGGGYRMVSPTEGEIQAPPDAMSFLNFFTHPETDDLSSFPAGQPVPEVSVWPDLADKWMRINCFGKT